MNTKTGMERYLRRRRSKMVDHKRRGRLSHGAYTARNPPRYRDGNLNGANYSGRKGSRQTTATIMED